MAIDDALLDAADRAGRAFLRLYRWVPACLSFGRNEPALTRYDRAAIERRGLAVVRRPTGGRAVWHEHEVTYAVAAPSAPFGTLAASYVAIHERLAAALRSLGADVRLAAAGRRPLSLHAGACFAAPVGGEVVAPLGKIVGSAQIRRGSAFLQHGSILLDGTQEVVRSVTRGTPSAGGEIGLAALLRRPVDFAEVAAAIVSAWDAGPAVGAPPVAPDGDAFADPAWTWRR
jgi:lipoate-protein ligase A